MEKSNSVQEIMANSIGKIRELVDSNTVIGTPIETKSGVTILPVSKITFSLISGGTDYANLKQKDLFGGAASSGASITPVGFLVIDDKNVRLIQLADNGRMVDRLLNMVPEVMDRVEGFVSKSNKKEEISTTNEEPTAI